jgi:hypothetical protein
MQLCRPSNTECVCLASEHVEGEEGNGNAAVDNGELQLCTIFFLDCSISFVIHRVLKSL